MSYYAGHPPTKEDAAVARWAASGRARSYTKCLPKLKEIKEGDEKVLALTLSSDLAMTFQRALSMGRQHRLSAHYTKAKRRETRTEKLDNEALVETLEFELQLKKKELEQALVPTDKQREELGTLARDYHRMRNKRDVIERNLTMLDEGDKKEVERWRDAWFEVDRLLDLVWTEAGILKLYESDGGARTERPVAASGFGNNRERSRSRDERREGRSDGKRRRAVQAGHGGFTEAAVHPTTRHRDDSRSQVAESDRPSERDDGFDQDERNGATQHHNMLQPVPRKERERERGGSRSAQGRDPGLHLHSHQVSDRLEETRRRRARSPRLRSPRLRSPMLKSPSRSRSRSTPSDRPRERNGRGRRASRDARGSGGYRDRGSVTRSQCLGDDSEYTRSSIDDHR
jgi:hypothetical protein